ncbi:MAG: cytochrome P450, partial [Deltaproteobacteria bacterium]|nr:cytochrome P450 [Deltaproteobacteria bacterium]
DFETYSSAYGTVLELMNGEPFEAPMIIFMDPPRQTRVRNLVSKAFTPRRISELEPKIRAIAAGYLDPLVGASRVDIVKEFTAKLPMDVISTLLGIPEGDRDPVRNASNRILHREPGSPLPGPDGLAAQGELMEYFDAAIAERRARPRDDIMTLLIEADLPASDGGGQLDDIELRAFFNLLATAGNETVTKLLATAFYWLAEFPGERQALIDEPGLAAGAVEEFLRFDPPSHYQARTLTRPVSLHGIEMPKGARVAIINGASGRDPRQFEEPDRLDVRREIDLHLGFGFGRHVCLGASLARLESRIALVEFLARFPAYEVTGVERMHSSNVRGLSGLTLQY